MTEREQLEAAIAANPEDDDARLAFADWLQEQDAKYKTCDRCNGKKWRMWRSRTAEMNSDEFCESSGPCECGSGFVLDTSDRDRAEFIRNQCRIDALRDHKEQPITEDGYDDPDGAGCCLCDELAELRPRTDKLLDVHPEWKEKKCPAVNHCDSYECPTCRNQDDLLVTICTGCDGIGEDARDGQGECGKCKGKGWLSRNPQFSRGFIESVECRLDEIGSEQEHGMDAGDFIPSPWAVAVVRALPVVKFRITDREPADRMNVNERWYWFRDNTTIRGDRNRLPGFIFDCLPDAKGDTIGLPFRTRDAAIDAIAIAAGNLVRRHVYPQIPAAC